MGNKVGRIWFRGTPCSKCADHNVVEVTIVVCNCGVHFLSMIYHCCLTVLLIPTILIFIFDEKTANKVRLSSMRAVEK